MKELKSFKDLADALKVSMTSGREDMQAVLMSSAKKLVGELNGDADGGDEDAEDAGVAGATSTKAEKSKSFLYELNGDAFVIGSNDSKIVERELGTGLKKPVLSLQAALNTAILEIEKQIGESLTATLAGEK